MITAITHTFHSEIVPLSKLELTDYIPFLAVISNLAQLIIKTLYIPFIEEKTLNQSYTLAYIQDKSLLRILFLLLPVIGNIACYFKDAIYSKYRDTEYITNMLKSDYITPENCLGIYNKAPFSVRIKREIISLVVAKNPNPLIYKPKYIQD